MSPNQKMVYPHYDGKNVYASYSPNSSDSNNQVLGPYYSQEFKSEVYLSYNYYAKTGENPAIFTTAKPGECGFGCKTVFVSPGYNPIQPSESTFSLPAFIPPSNWGVPAAPKQFSGFI